MIFDQGLNLDTWKHTNLDRDGFPERQAGLASMINFFESVTMNPLGKAMGIIYLDFESKLQSELEWFGQ